MSPAVKYTLGRIGLFAAVLLMVAPVTSLSWAVKALIALVVSMPLSWFVLRKWRDQTSAAIADGVARRRGQRADLRAALAGDDEAKDTEPPAGKPSAGKPSADKPSADKPPNG